MGSQVDRDIGRSAVVISCLDLQEQVCMQILPGVYPSMLLSNSSWIICRLMMTRIPDRKVTIACESQGSRDLSLGHLRRLTH